MHSFPQIRRIFERECLAVRVAMLLSVVAAVIYGGGKGDGGDPPLRGGPSRGAPQDLGAFTDADQALGFACVTNPAAVAGLRRSGGIQHTDALAAFETSGNAVAKASWLATGVFDDYFTLMPPKNAPVCIGTNAVRRLMVFSHGSAKAVLENGNAAYLEPFHAPMSFIAEGKWNEYGVTSRCWTASSPASTIVAWEGALLNRNTSQPLSFQIEFLQNGNFIYRYGETDAIDSLTNATFSIGRLYTSSPPCGTSSVTGAISRVSSLYFADISTYGDGTGDTDDDGLTDYGELMILGTDPLVADTDGDGLGDGAEIVSGTDPFDFDTDGDGIPDGWSSLSYATHPLWASESPDVVVTLEGDLPPGVSALLRINNLPVILHSATNLPLRCGEGEMLGFDLRNPSGAAVPLSVSILSGCAYRLENNGLFSEMRLRRGGSRGGPGGVTGPVTALLIFPSLALVLDDSDAIFCDDGHCLHGCGDGVRFRIDAEPSDCAGILDNIVLDGFAAGDSCCRFYPPSGTGGTATASVDGNWLTEGSVGTSVSMHWAEFSNHTPCAVCHGLHPPGFCEGEDPRDEDGEEGLGRFLRIGGTVDIGGGWAGWFSHCCGPVGWPLAELSLSGSSGNLDATMLEDVCIEVEGTGASGGLGADHVDYSIDVDGYGTFDGRMHFTVADIRLQFDYDGSGSISQSEKDRAADAQTNSTALAWAIPHRQEPYRVDYVVKACEGLTATAAWPPYSSGGLFLDENLATNAPPFFTDFGNRRGPNTFWLATTNSDYTASFAFSLRCDSVTASLLAEHLGIHVRCTDLGERWVVHGSQQNVEYWRPSIEGDPLWTLRGPSNSVAAAASGNTFSVSPASLATGDYTLTVRDPDLVREGFAHNTATGMLHLVETRLGTNALAIIRNATAGSASGRQRLSLAPEATQSADWRISPTGAGGARLYASAAGGQPLTAVANAAAVWIEAGEECGDYTVTATHPDCPQSSDSATVSVVEGRMAVDYGFRNLIDDADFAQAETGRVFTIWLNNDNDDSEEEGHEVPGQTGSAADSSDAVVNGLGDLIDWFPLCLDLTQIHQAFPLEQGYSYRFAQADNALSFIWTALTKQHAGDFLTSDLQCAGNYLNQSLTNTPVARMSGGTIEIPSDVLLELDDFPIFIVEGRSATSAPLAFEVMDGSSLVARIELPLCVCGIEDMFRFANIRQSIGGSASPASRLGVPAHRPYIPNGKNVFLVHGFRVGANESRGWGSEFFKKLLRSGSRADFWMVTWESDASALLDPAVIDYYRNVDNAFLSAPYLANLVNSVQGDKVILAHSLGNMVVSSAIQDHGMDVDKYFALNSAVASEAYDATLFDTATNNPLVHSEWVSFTNASWSATWHDYFGANDDRSRLTWRSRFADVPTLTEMYNFYSSGDEVLEIGPQGITVLDWDQSVRQYTWHKQEAFKGRNIIYGTGWAGWGFESNVTAQAVNAASPETLRDFPIFEHDPAEMFSTAITTNMQNRILAKGIPALSNPAGITSSFHSRISSDNIFDMNSFEKSHFRKGESFNGRWLHSDIQNSAFFFSGAIFHELITQGGLQ